MSRPMIRNAAPYPANYDRTGLVQNVQGSGDFKLFGNGKPSSARTLSSSMSASAAKNFPSQVASVSVGALLSKSYCHDD